MTQHWKQSFELITISIVSAAETTTEEKFRRLKKEKKYPFLHFKLLSNYRGRITIKAIDPRSVYDLLKIFHRSREIGRRVTLINILIRPM